MCYCPPPVPLSPTRGAPSSWSNNSSNAENAITSVGKYPIPIFTELKKWAPHQKSVPWRIRNFRKQPLHLPLLAQVGTLRAASLSTHVERPPRRPSDPTFP